MVDVVTGTSKSKAKEIASPECTGLRIPHQVENLGNQTEATRFLSCVIRDVCDRRPSHCFLLAELFTGSRAIGSRRIGASLLGEPFGLLVTTASAPREARFCYLVPLPQGHQNKSSVFGAIGAILEPYATHNSQLGSAETRQGCRT